MDTSTDISQFTISDHGCMFRRCIYPRLAFTRS